MRWSRRVALGCLLGACAVAVLAATACGRSIVSPGAGDDAGDDGVTCTACAGTCLAGRCLTEIAVAGAPNGPAFIAVDATTLYWGDPTTSFNADTGDLGMTPLDGGAPVLLASSLRTTGIAVDDTGLYWTNGKSFGGGDAAVLKMPLGGGTVTTLASSLQSANAIALDATNVYFLGESGISAVAKNGGPVQTVVAVPPSAFANTPSTFAIDSTSLYWFEGCDGGNCLESMPSGGGAPVTIFVGSQLDYFGGIAAAGGNAYFSLLACDYDAACGASLLQAPANGGAVATLASGFAFVSPVVADSTHAYLGGNRCSDADVDGSCPQAVWRVAADGGEVVALATRPSGAFALDDTSVYWSEGNGKVARLTPR